LKSNKSTGPGCYKSFKKKSHNGRVDRLVSEHLRIQRTLNPHTLFLCFSSPKNICSSPPSTLNEAKIAQFDKGMRKIWGKGV
jgi:hypothetical protein